mmetsp:Transcript_38486/g.127024  ORF Transcript_38486/g.127024 Transcript_38486/m.127024 type:complete len:208 (+) Transcript_38486:621-1244(+)
MHHVEAVQEGVARLHAWLDEQARGAVRARLQEQASLVLARVERQDHRREGGDVEVRGEGLPPVLLAVGAQQGVRHHDPLAAAAAVVHPLAHVGENAALEGGLQQPVQLLADDAAVLHHHPSMCRLGSRAASQRVEGGAQRAYFASGEQALCQMHLARRCVRRRRVGNLRRQVPLSKVGGGMPTASPRHGPAHDRIQLEGPDSVLASH